MNRGRSDGGRQSKRTCEPKGMCAPIDAYKKSVMRIYLTKWLNRSFE